MVQNNLSQISQKRENLAPKNFKSKSNHLVAEKANANVIQKSSDYSST